jgi:hypothetical protein
MPRGGLLAQRRPNLLPLVPCPSRLPPLAFIHRHKSRLSACAAGRLAVAVSSYQRSANGPILPGGKDRCQIMSPQPILK